MQVIFSRAKSYEVLITDLEDGSNITLRLGDLYKSIKIIEINKTELIYEENDKANIIRF